MGAINQLARLLSAKHANFFTKHSPKTVAEVFFKVLVPAAAALAGSIANQTALASALVTAYNHPIIGQPVCAHADAQDTFIFQLEGCRVWNLTRIVQLINFCFRTVLLYSILAFVLSKVFKQKDQKDIFFASTGSEQH